MEQNHKQRRRINTSLRKNLRFQVAVASAFIIAVISVAVFSLKQESSLAGQDSASGESNKLELINVRNASEESFAPLKRAEMLREVLIAIDDNQETLDIDFGKALESKVEIRIYNMFGEFVTGDHISPGVTALTYKLNLIEPGVYTLKTITTERTFTSKIVIPKD